MALRRLVRTIQEAREEATQEDIALCLMLTVAVIETFLNLFFRVAVSEPAFSQYEELILRDLRRRSSLDHKLRKWPHTVFGQPLNLDDPVVQSFLALKERRNALMHFTSTHEALIGDGFEIRGLADTSVFDNLTPADATAALEITQGMLCVLLRHRGIPEASLPAALHLWTGLPPG